MFRVTLENLLAHRRRLLSTFLAVVLGIAFLSGTIVLGDTIKAAFNHLLATVNSGTDAYVRRVAISNGSAEEGVFGQGRRGELDESVTATVKAVPGVAAAEGEISAGGVQILDRKGDVIGGAGPAGRSRGGSWKVDAHLNAFQLVSGRAPESAGDVVIDRASAKTAGYRPGDAVSILTPDRHQFTVTGIAKFGTEDSPGGGSYALFTLPEAESLFTAPGKVDAVAARAAPGVSQDTLVKRIAPVLPNNTEVLTGAAIIKETQDSFQQRIGTFTTVLGSFAFVAVIVGGFVIYNTFSILVAQRSRETALLRALGATRRQVLRAQLLESFLVAVIASAIGVVAGIGVGALLRAMFRAGGFPFPPGGLVFHASAAVIGLTVGVFITMLAAVMPAVRASRVAPVAALRESAIDTSHTSRGRLVIGTVITVLGVGLVLGGVVAKRAAPIGFGAALSVIGTVILGPVVARPMAAIVGSPPARFRGVAGVLARQNAMRNPRRTAGTAAALMVGVAVVAFFTVLGASLQATTTDQISRSFVGDLAIATKGFGGGGLSPELSKQVNNLSEVDVAAALRGTEAQVNGDNQFLIATNPVALQRVLAIDVVSGSLRDLGVNKVAVSDTKAKSAGLEVGDSVNMVFPETGSQRFTVGAVFKKNDVLSSYVITTEANDANVVRPRDQQIFVKFRSGVPFERGRTAVEAVAKPYPNATVQDEHDLKQSYVQQINSFLAIIFGMLALAIIIALMGISNTLQLSVYERTRELGLLRSVGSLRSQVRSMVRWEAVIIALFGTVGGLLLGVAFGWAIVHGLGRDQHLLFAVPAGRIVLIMIVGAVAGVLAALRPASRASRLNILQAIATE